MIGDETTTTVEWIDAAVREIPFVGAWVRDGSRDSIYDLLMAAGPILLILIRIFGRELLTEGLVLLYLLSFVGYLSYKYVRYQG